MVNSGNPVYDAIMEFIGFITPFAFVAVIFYGCRILFSAKKFSNPKTK